MFTVNNIHLMIDKTRKIFTEIVKFVKNGEIDKLSLGTSIIYLNSIFEHLHSIEMLMDKGLIESAGSIATSLWERSITLQYILTNPTILSKEHSEHKFLRKTPWNIKHMINCIIDNEHTNFVKNKKIEKETFYFQYTYLCAIKHGNPYTLSYLNRLSKSNEDDNIIGLKPNFSPEDTDLKKYILLLSITTALDALYNFSRIYCTYEKTNELKLMKSEYENIIVNNIPLKVPQIIYGSLNEFSDDFIEHAKEIVRILATAHKKR